MSASGIEVTGRQVTSFDDGAVDSLAAPDRERGVGHRDVQDREQPVGVGHRQVVGVCDLVRGLIPVDAGIALPEHARAPSDRRCASIRSCDRAP